MKSTVLTLLVGVFLVCNSVPTEEEFAKERHNMVVQQIRQRGIGERSVLDAMEAVPRHRFVPPALWSQAYGDFPLPIGQGQTISQPYVVALMTEMLQLASTDKVLEIGTGSGYQAAVLCEIANQVFSIEIHRALADRAANLLEELGYKNFKVKSGDGYFGWAEHAPFDAIMITAAANQIPPPLIRQLKEGGRLVAPLEKTDYYQELTLFIKKKGKNIIKKQGAVRFVPMTGAVRKKGYN